MVKYIKSSGNTNRYKITFDCSGYYNGNKIIDDWEIFYGTAEELNEYVRKLRNDNCYNIRIEHIDDLDK